MGDVRYCCVGTLALPPAASAQDANIQQPIAEIEHQLAVGQFKVRRVELRNSTRLEADHGEGGRQPRTRDARKELSRLLSQSVQECTEVY